MNPATYCPAGVLPTRQQYSQRFLTEKCAAPAASCGFLRLGPHLISVYAGLG
jgi:hypothetical protein